MKTLNHAYGYYFWKTISALKLIGTAIISAMLFYVFVKTFVNFIMWWTL